MWEFICKSQRPVVKRRGGVERWRRGKDAGTVAGGGTVAGVGKATKFLKSGAIIGTYAEWTDITSTREPAVEHGEVTKSTTASATTTIRSILLDTII